MRFDAIAAPAYAYLLGVYLGDGCLTVYSPTPAVLRISCAAEYPALIADITNAIERVQAGRPVWRVRTPHLCVVLACSSPRWPGLLPQHGPGRKHARQIALQGWQQQIQIARRADVTRLDGFVGPKG